LGGLGDGGWLYKYVVLLCVQENQESLKSISQLSAYADDVNILGENIDTIKKNTEAPLDTGKEVHLEVNSGKTKYILMPHSQKTGQSIA
jgi:hypothetical protein